MSESDLRDRLDKLANDNDVSINQENWKYCEKGENIMNTLECQLDGSFPDTSHPLIDDKDMDGWNKLDEPIWAMGTEEEGGFLTLQSNSKLVFTFGAAIDWRE